MIEVKLKGISEALKEAKRLTRWFPEAGFRALVRRAELVMTDAKEHFVPVRDGQLRGSGHVVPEKEKKQVTLGFGGPAGIGNQGDRNSEDVGYAVVQHEEKFQHVVGTDHYLLKPLQNAAPTMGAAMAADIKQELGS